MSIVFMHAESSDTALSDYGSGDRKIEAGMGWKDKVKVIAG